MFALRSTGRPRNRSLAALLCGTTLALGLTAAIPAIAGGAPRGRTKATVLLCHPAGSRALRLPLGDRAHCARGERPLRLAVAGRRGPAGPKGEAGPPGQAGAGGPQGPPGTSPEGTVAGGALTGAYPNPGLASGSVGLIQLTGPLRALLPTAPQAAALAGSSGEPSAANPYLTAEDPRNSDPRAPTGPAGGALAGSYPEPILAPGAITGIDRFAPGAVPAARVAMGPEPQIESPMTPGAHLSWLTPEFDVGGLYDIESSEELTAPVAGIYEVSANVQIADTDGNPEGEIKLMRSGSPLALGLDGGLMDPSSPNDTGPAFSATAIASLAAGEGVFVEWSSASSNTVAALGDSSLSMHWIGPPPAS